MARYILRRLFLGVFAVLGATIVVFTLSRIGGDPRYLYVSDASYGVDKEVWEAWGEKLGLDRPLVVQYGMWIGRAMRGDLGNSTAAQRPVIGVLKEKSAATLQIAVASWVLSFLVGIPLGVLSALTRGRAVDYAARIFALLGQSAPTFWLGIIGILIFSVQFGWLPAGTRGEGIAISNMVLPVFVLGLHPMASYLRLTRSSMLEILDSEYIKFARAKGVREWLVIWKHGFKNAFLVPLTFSGMLLVHFLTGTVVVETVFSWPGLGRLAIQSIWASDFPTLSTLVMFFAALYVVAVLILDILYAALDPRIRYT
ncbi:MAG: ABC transporter permease [Chloroflexota bacterium]|nr:ABC transporter permease [Chloroflexota bacterium]